MAKKKKPLGADGHRERMFSKLTASGDTEILPRDILEMLLYFPVRVRDTRDMAVELMKNSDGDFYRVLSAQSEELCKVRGIGPAAANFLSVVGNIVNREDKLEQAEELILPIAARISDIFDNRRDEIKGDELWAIFLDSQSEIIDTLKVRNDFGIPSKDETYPILQRAARTHSPFVILAHVTGKLEIYPTGADNRLFQYMKGIFAYTNLKLVAYYIVGGDEILRLQGD